MLYSKDNATDSEDYGIVGGCRDARDKGGFGRSRPLSRSTMPPDARQCEGQYQVARPRAYRLAASLARRATRGAWRSARRIGRAALAVTRAAHNGEERRASGPRGRGVPQNLHDTFCELALVTRQPSTVTQVCSSQFITLPVTLRGLVTRHNEVCKCDSLYSGNHSTVRERFFF